MRVWRKGIMGIMVQKAHGCNLDLVLVKEHVWYTIADGKHTTCLRALQLTLEHVDLEEQMVKLLQKQFILHNVFRLNGRNVFCEFRLKNKFQLLTNIKNNRF